MPHHSETKPLTTKIGAVHLQRAFARSLHRHWFAYLVEGIILLVLGLAAIVVPAIATMTVAIFLGSILVIAGFVGLISTIVARHAPGFWSSLFSAVAEIVAGAVLMVAPIGTVGALTLVLVVFFLLEGIASGFYALAHRRALSRRWAWVLAAGFIDLVIVTVLLLGLPGRAEWAFGLLIGVNMVLGGVSLIAISLRASDT